MKRLKLSLHSDAVLRPVGAGPGTATGETTSMTGRFVNVRRGRCVNRGPLVKLATVPVLEAYKGGGKGLEAEWGLIPRLSLAWS